MTETQSSAAAPSLSLAFIAAASVVLVATVVVDSPVPLVAATILAAAALLSLVPARQISWPFLVTALILLILFVPIRRYTFPEILPFELEPYRVFVAVLLGGWVVSLLIDPTVRIRRTVLDAPIAVVAGAIVASVVVNPGRVGGLQADVIKSVTFFASFLLVFYLVASVVRSEREVEFLSKVLLIGGTAVALLAVLEYRTGVNVYDRAMAHVPLLTFHAGANELIRSEGVRRAFGSAEHPIALGAALAMMAPLAVYAAKTSSRRIWWAVAVLLGLGMLATVSRTSVMMVGAAGVVMFWLRPRDVKRLLPLAIVALVLAKVAVPGSLGTLQYFFFPQEGLVAQQQSSAGSCGSAGRIADLGPALSEFSKKPILGYGFGTRIPAGDRANACILDNQWLATLLDMGLVGVIGVFWLFSRFIRQLSWEARRDASAAGWLPTALASSIAAYAAGMLTFDAFSFVQATLLMFILLGLGAATVAVRGKLRFA